MQVLRKSITIAVLLLLPSFAVAEEEKQSLSSTKWEAHLKIGTQTYLNGPDSGSAGLSDFLIGYRLSDRSMIGASYATASYEIRYFSVTTDQKQIGS